MVKAKRITGTEVVKHRNEINRVKGDYTVLEEKLFVLVYSKLTGLESELPPITLLTTDVCRALGTRYEDMRRAMRRLTVTPMEVGHIDDLESDFEVIMPIIRFVHLAKEKTITITLNPALKDYFLAVRQQFTTYVAEHCYRLSSRYSIRIYKLVMQWWSKIEALGEWEVVLDYQELREYFLFKPTQYRKTTDFRDKVLLPSLSDINQARVGLDLELVGVRKAGRDITDYVVRARKATMDTPNRAVKTKGVEPPKSLTQQLIEDNLDRYLKIKETLLKQRSLYPELEDPNMREIRINAEALKILREELKK